MPAPPSASFNTRPSRQRVSPTGALLLVVGDVRPAAALDAVEAALGDWAVGSSPAKAPALPSVSAGALMLVDRPGAVQSNLRLAGPGLRRSDPGYAALQLANTIFGGYFSSRLVANLREDKGYTYSPRSGLEHTSVFVIRRSPTGVAMLGMRSMAGSFWHALETAAARVGGGQP